MGKDTDNFRESMSLEDVEEFESFLMTRKGGEKERRERNGAMWDVSVKRANEAIHIGSNAEPEPFRTISKPNDPSIIKRTRSATLAISIMALRSLAHSMKVNRRCLPVKIPYAKKGSISFQR